MIAGGIIGLILFAVAGRLVITGVGIGAISEGSQNLQRTVQELGAQRMAESSARRKKEAEAAAAAAAERKRAADEAKMLADLAKEQQRLTLARNTEEQRKRLTPECRFWWTQNDENPSERAQAEKNKHCNVP